MLIRLILVALSLPQKSQEQKVCTDSVWLISTSSDLLLALSTSVPLKSTFAPSGITMVDFVIASIQVDEVTGKVAIEWPTNLISDIAQLKFEQGSLSDEVFAQGKTQKVYTVSSNYISG